MSLFADGFCAGSRRNRGDARPDLSFGILGGALEGQRTNARNCTIGSGLQQTMMIHAISNNFQHLGSASFVSSKNVDLQCPINEVSKVGRNATWPTSAAFMVLTCFDS